MAEGRAQAKVTLDGFATKYAKKYPNAVDCLTRDQGYAAGIL